MDAIGRLAMLTVSTAILSRCLSPHDFGLAALVLTVVSVASVAVGAPFEEALAQRKVLRLVHLRASLTGCWLFSLAWVLASVPLGYALAWAYHEPQIASLLPVCMASTFFSGHSDVLTGLVRRQRRFTDLAKATLFGNAVGISASVAIALMGGGVWSLVAQRLLVVIFRAVSLQSRIEIVILPSRSIGHLRDLARYGGLAFIDRMMDNLTFLAFNYLVGGFYGVNTLGYVNMAMRLVEPIRGAIGATGHNVAFSFFTRLQNDHERLRDRAQTVISNASLAIAPVFVGLAAVTPVLLPLVSGPGWDQAVEIGVCLAIGSAIAIPARLIFTALSAKARPEYSVIANVAGFAGTLAVLLFATKTGADQRRPLAHRRRPAAGRDRHQRLAAPARLVAARTLPHPGAGLDPRGIDGGFRLRPASRLAAFRPNRAARPVDRPGRRGLRPCSSSFSRGRTSAA